jgi:hypothetical protein
MNSPAPRTTVSAPGAFEWCNLIRITTYSGGVLDLEAPTSEMIRIEDIVQGLSNTCRFSGQVEEFYSVLQHAMLVASLVDPSTSGRRCTTTTPRRTCATSPGT